MRLLRWAVILLVVLAVLYSAVWFVAALVVDNRVGVELDRAVKRGVQVSATHRGAEGLLGLGFRYQLTDAKYELVDYGATISTPGKTSGGVHFFDPLTATARIPAGTQITSPLVVGTLGEIQTSAQLTTSAKIDALTASMESLSLNALGLVQIAMDSMALDYSAYVAEADGAGALSAFAHMEGVKLPGFVKTLVEQQLPSGPVLPEEDIDIVVKGSLLPQGPVLDDDLSTIEPWLREGGHLALSELNLPLHELMLTPKKALVFMSRADSINAIVCPMQCTGAACQPDFTIQNLSIADNGVISQMRLPGSFAGMSGVEVCAAL